MASHSFRQGPAHRDLLGTCTNLLDQITTIVSAHLLTPQDCAYCAHAMDIVPSNDLTATNLNTLAVLRECSNRLHDMVVRLQTRDVGRQTAPLAASRFTQTGHKGCAPQSARQPENIKVDVLLPSHMDERASCGGSHDFEDISVGKDGKQILRLSPGEAWSAKRVTVGEGAVQMIGVFSDMSVRNSLDRL